MASIMRYVTLGILGVFVLCSVNDVRAQMAQPAPPGVTGTPGQVVDQAVQDLDPLATSLRRMNPGNALYNNDGRIYQLRPPGPWTQAGLPALDNLTGLNMPQQYIYRAPGVQAYMDRPDYLVRPGAMSTRRRNVAPHGDGKFVEMIPAGVVFDLVPRQPGAQVQPQAADDWVDHRIDGRIDNRIDGRIETQLPVPSNVTVNPPPNPRSE